MYRVPKFLGKSFAESGYACLSNVASDISSAGIENSGLLPGRPDFFWYKLLLFRIFAHW
ncbi:MAG: hypothetical protein K8R37_09550 [Bacteroidales bacterium]|nr:hypothetical protein [Bacteroidales bacterium]